MKWLAGLFGGKKQPSRDDLVKSGVVKPFHVIQRSVVRNPVLQFLIVSGRFDMEAHENILFLATDPRAAAATGTPRYVDEEPTLAAKQHEMLDTFAAKEAIAGWTNLSLLQANPRTLAPDLQQARDRVLGEARQFVEDLRDFTAKGIVEGKLRWP
jgi:hypothetical protein